MPSSIGPEHFQPLRQCVSILDPMEQPLGLQLVERFSLETELHSPHGLPIFPSVPCPHVLKPDLARLLEFARLVIDAAGHRSTRREVEARALQPIGIAT